jgi:hypothetical protein
MLHIANLGKSFGTTPVFDAVSLELRRAVNWESPASASPRC